MGDQGLYRNTGARFLSEEGEVVEKGQVFRPTPTDLKKRKYKLEPVGARTRGPGAAPLPSPTRAPRRRGRTPRRPERVVEIEGVPDSRPAPAASEPQEGSEEGEGGWPLRMEPALYLQLHPEGPNAELAREILGQAEESEEATDEPEEDQETDESEEEPEEEVTGGASSNE